MNSIKSALIGARVFARAVIGASLPAFVLSVVTTALPFDAFAAKLTPSASQPTAASTYTIKPVKSRLGRISETDPSLLNRADSTPVRVMVKLDYDAVASYEGNVPGYAATSPKKTGKKLRQNKAAVDAYTRYAAGYEAQVLAQIASRIPAAKIGQSFRVVYGGVAVTLPANKISDLLAIGGVVAVQRDNLEQPSTDVTPAFLGATSVWPLIGGPTKAGEGVLVGVLDTGLWPEHQSFADHGLAPLAGGPFPCQFGGSNDAAFACNNKLVGAYAFLNTYLAVFGPSADEFCLTGGGHTCSARDAEGHGTHTTSTAAGGPVDHATLLGTDRGHISGMAPGAQIIMYRVCRAAGCFNSDSIAAVSQAITDGVDVINFSIGGGSSAYTDAVELAFFDAYVAGVIVNASAGNSGPGAATAEHTGPWVNTVGASSSNRAFISTLHLSASGASLDVNGVTVTAPMPATPVVINTGDPFCLNPAAPGTFSGKVVVCQRGGGGLGRVSKGFNVLQGNAAGMILYNPTKQELESDNHWLPAIHIEGPATGTTGDTAKVLAFLAAHTNATAQWTTGIATPITGDVMAAFSSRGPAGDFIKPDVTAPGVSILAGMTPQPDPADVTLGPAGQFFQAIAGTSMSSPHAAGVAALIRAVHPDWTPGQVKSALMTSSVQDTLKEDGVTPADPFDRGAGAIRADRAVNPTVTFDVGPLDYVTSATDVIGRVHLNLPSINAPTMPGEITTYRTMRNVSGAPQNLAISATAPPGVDIIVAKAPKGSKTAQTSDSSIVLAKDEEVTFQVTIRAAALPEGQRFGQIVLDPKKKGYNAVVLPVAFNKRQGGVALTQGCSPSSFPTSSHTTCEVHAENLLSADATVGIEVDPSNGLGYANVVTTVGSPAATLSGSAIKWNGTLAGTTPPDIFIAPMGAGDSTPAGGYLPLSLFGTPAIAGAGDETIHNFNVPAFSYGGETYTRLGIVSNGYIVIGGGTSDDVDFINQNLPNPTRPNNVIAPFWTDLNPAAGGAMRIDILTDGVNNWIVVDFDAVREFGTVKTATFEVWIGLNGNAMPEDVSIDYGTFTSTGTDGFVTVGAENRTGTRGQNVFVDGANGTGVFPVNGTMLRVTSSPPLPGGAVTFHYDASAKKAGSYTSTANMTSNLTPGTTQDVEVLTVTP